MVHVFLNQESYNPGDELRVAVTPSRSDRIQLLSVRCVGYIRVPSTFAKDMNNRNAIAGSCGIVKLFIPYFLPPSLKGGLVEICHYLEVSILNKGEFDMRVKKIPLLISSVRSMPKLVAPAIGDGYEQIDFSLPPANQWTPHGRRCSGWEAVDVIRRKTHRRTVSGIFKSRRGFRISFNNQHAMEIVTHGEWLSERMLVEDGSPVNVQYRFEDSGVMVRRVTVRFVRIERIKNQADLSHVSCVSETTPLPINECSVEASHTVPIPRLTCPSFDSDLVSLEYQLDFEIRAVDANSLAILEPVVWSLPVDVVPFDGELFSQSAADPLPAIPFGGIKPLERWKGFDETFPESPSEPLSNQESEIDSVKFASLSQPGSMRFTIFS